MASVNLSSGKLGVVIAENTQRAVQYATNRVKLRARASIIGQGRYDTGAMMAGFVDKDVTTDPKRITRRITNVTKEFPFQELGTPKEAPGIGFIYPKKPGGVMVFKPKGSMVLVFARRVRGVRPGNFLRNAAKQTQARDFSE